jgi:hypothetical protein
MIRKPTFATLIEPPLLPLLGATKQATVEESGNTDAEALARRRTPRLRR